jgi:hypothetical protein
MATSLLSILIIGFKGSVAAYVVFFGLYGFVKYYIERFRNTILEIAVKLAFFNITIGTLYYFYKMFFVGIPKVNMPIYVVVIMLQFVLIVFDYALTLFISYINRRLPNRQQRS